MSQEKYLTTRIWSETLKILRFIRAHTGEKIVAIIHRLAVAELERIEREEGHHSSKAE